TPVSTTAASLPRTKTYADTKPRLTRDQASSPAASPLGPVDSGVVESVGLFDPAGVAAPPSESFELQAATPSTAMPRAPRPTRVTSQRRLTARGCHNVMSRPCASVGHQSRVSPGRPCWIGRQACDYPPTHVHLRAIRCSHADRREGVH